MLFLFIFFLLQFLFDWMVEAGFGLNKFTLLESCVGRLERAWKQQIRVASDWLGIACNIPNGKMIYWTHKSHTRSPIFITIPISASFAETFILVRNKFFRFSSHWIIIFFSICTFWNVLAHCTVFRFYRKFCYYFRCDFFFNRA